MSVLLFDFPLMQDHFIQSLNQWIETLVPIENRVVCHERCEKLREALVAKNGAEVARLLGELSKEEGHISAGSVTFDIIQSFFKNPMGYLETITAGRDALQNNPAFKTMVSDALWMIGDYLRANVATLGRKAPYQEMARYYNRAVGENIGNTDRQLARAKQYQYGYNVEGAGMDVDTAVTRYDTLRVAPQELYYQRAKLQQQFFTQLKQVSRQMRQADDSHARSVADDFERIIREKAIAFFSKESPVHTDFDALKSSLDNELRVVEKAFKDSPIGKVLKASMGVLIAMVVSIPTLGLFWVNKSGREGFHDTFFSHEHQRVLDTTSSFIAQKKDQLQGQEPPSVRLGRLLAEGARYQYGDGVPMDADKACFKYQEYLRQLANLSAEDSNGIPVLEESVRVTANQQKHIFSSLKKLDETLSEPGFFMKTGLLIVTRELDTLKTEAVQLFSKKDMTTSDLDSFRDKLDSAYEIMKAHLSSESIKKKPSNGSIETAVINPKSAREVRIDVVIGSLKGSLDSISAVLFSSPSPRAS